MIAIGVIAIAVGFMTDPTRAWPCCSRIIFYFTAIALCGTFFVALNYVSQTGWTVAIKRVLKQWWFLKYGAIGMILIFLLGTTICILDTQRILSETFTGCTPNPAFDRILLGKHGFSICRSSLSGWFFILQSGLALPFCSGENPLQEDIDGAWTISEGRKLGAIFWCCLPLHRLLQLDFSCQLIPIGSPLFGWYTFIGCS